MRFLTEFLIAAGVCGLAVSSAFAEEDISAAAARISKNKAEMERLNRQSVQTGQTIANIGDLSIEDFLELKAVPDGLDAVGANDMYRANDSFTDMTTKEAVEAVKIMRQNGIDLPEGLEKEIQKNPDDASKLMMDAFSTIQPPEYKTPDDAKAIRRQVIRKTENTLGIPFRSLLEQQKKQMTTLKKK